MSFYGAERAVDHYNLMGPVKAALESSVRYLAADLATHQVHVHAISAGAVKTRAASGLDQFDVLLDGVRTRTPAQHLVTIEEIGRIAAVLASDAGMTLTGSTIYADAGFHVWPDVLEMIALYRASIMRTSRLPPHLVLI